MAQLREKFTEQTRKMESVERRMKVKIEECAIIIREIQEAEEKLVKLLYTSIRERRVFFNLMLSLLIF